MPLELRTTRRSPRIQKEKPSYTGEFIDSFGDSSLATQKRKFKCINTLNNVNNNDKERDDDEEEEEEDIDYEEMKNSVRVAAMRHMEVVRKALLSTTISDEVRLDIRTCAYILISCLYIPSYALCMNTETCLFFRKQQQKILGDKKQFVVGVQQLVKYM
jgi:hypothetical protein